jgi:uncharacterized membrane protein
MAKGQLTMGRTALLLLPLAACAPAPPAADPAREHYEAVGNEPGWRLTIHDGRIDYVGDYGDTRIGVARPEPRPSINGRRYYAGRLVVDVTFGPCNDAMSGRAYADRVTVTTNGKTVQGCGGGRMPHRDM